MHSLCIVPHNLIQQSWDGGVYLELLHQVDQRESRHAQHPWTFWSYFYHEDLLRGPSCSTRFITTTISYVYESHVTIFLHIEKLNIIVHQCVCVCVCVCVCMYMVDAVQ